MTDNFTTPKPIEQITPHGRKVLAYSAEYLIALWCAGKKLIPTFANGRAFNLEGLCTAEDFAKYSEAENKAIRLIYLDPDFWSIERFRKESWRFEGIRDLPGKTYVRDEQGNKIGGPYMLCKGDIDSQGAYEKYRHLLEEDLLNNTYVTKTRKQYGRHFDWLDHQHLDIDRLHATLLRM